MNVVGLITEYNPFHNGHLYHIEKAKELTNADAVVVVMSGNFVQRGTIAITDKYARTKMALAAGADLVIELPVCYATSSAPYFALGAISILHQLGFVTHLVFGSECGDIRLLDQVASIYHKEPEAISDQIKSYLKCGDTYPTARAKATMDYLITSNPSMQYEITSLLDSPNNILGIEYLRALKILDSPITPLTIKRIKAHFHSEDIQGNINSATAIRKAFEENDMNGFDLIKESIPEFVYEFLQEEHSKTFPMGANDLSQILQYQLLKETKESLMRYFDLSPDLIQRLLKQKIYHLSFEELVGTLKTRQYTQTRIQRALLHIILGITTDDLNEFVNYKVTPYARILGLKKTASHLLKRVPSDSNFTVITKLANANLSELGQKMLDLDIKASSIFNLLASQKYHYYLKDEYTKGIILF